MAKNRKRPDPEVAPKPADQVEPDASEQPPEDTTPPEDDPTKEAEKVDEPPKPAPPKPELSPMPLAVFVRVCGRKPDQMAGFKLWARAEKPRTIPEWHKLHEKFLARPV